jgi:hypothetical protein
MHRHVCYWYVFETIKSVLRYQFLVLDISYPDIVYLHEKGCEELWLYFIANRGPQAKAFG